MRVQRPPADLLEAARRGERAALARLISVVEQGGEPARDVGRLVYPLGGTAYSVGVTGAPGAGKSTLTSGVIRALRAAGDAVAVLAVDPSSPFTGGAVLGDRVRMQDHALDAGVFIRSMATRGHLGGLALATPEAVRVLDAAGFDWVLIETVGVGQAEVEVAGEADTTVVVINPGWGDAVQASKAGLLEVADVFVINKADRPGVPEARRDLEYMLDLAGIGDADWRPPIVATVAAKEEGVDTVIDAIVSHRRHLETSGELERRRLARLGAELHQIVAERVTRRVGGALDGPAADGLRDRLAAREIDPYTAADELLDAAGLT
ncbi:MAG: methylmalonyl Co-A mutase-associated GTPase MeaB [Acidimicrobiales bacterium]